MLIAIPCLLNGGTERQSLMLSEVLRSCGHAVSILCYFEFEEAIVKEFRVSGSEVILLQMNRGSGSLTVINRLRKAFRKIRPDVVPVQYMAPGALPVIAARLAGVRKVFATVHQPYTASHGRFAKLILRMASLLCTKFIAVSVNTEKSWFGIGQLFDENTPRRFQPYHFTIYNSIDTERILDIASAVKADNLKRRMSIPTDIPVIGAVSRLRHEKGIDLLIDAFNQILKEGTAAHLLIVGSGPDGEKLKEKVQEYDLNSYVTIYGEADWETAMRLMALLDIVVVPSRFEGFGLTAAEAMAAGKPLVASAVFGLKEVVIHEKTGLLFPPENTGLLATNLHRLCADSELRNKLGNEGRLRAESVFGMELFSKKISALYNSF